MKRSVFAICAQVLPLARASSSSTCLFPSPDEVLQFTLRNSWDAGRNSKVLRFSLPSTMETLSRPIPSGVSVLYQSDEKKVLKKSYSPVSPPDAEGYFDLLVKAYPPRVGGGVGAFLCALAPGDPVSMQVKAPRKVHGSETLSGRWAQMGFVAGGTGVAPFVQIIRTLLANETDSTQLSLLYVNRTPDDILMKEELDMLAAQSNGRFRVTYALTQANQEFSDLHGDSFYRGRGSSELAVETLPFPISLGDAEGVDNPTITDSREQGTMIMVCGTDGFVDSWAGAITRIKDPVTGEKKKIQGPLTGWLRDAGYTESEVYKF